jgi:hypothetical protein
LELTRLNNSQAAGVASDLGVRCFWASYLALKILGAANVMRVRLTLLKEKATEPLEP